MACHSELLVHGGADCGISVIVSLIIMCVVFCYSYNTSLLVIVGGVISSLTRNEYLDLSTLKNDHLSNLDLLLLSWKGLWTLLWIQLL